jgi:hypothetical protein
MKEHHWIAVLVTTIASLCITGVVIAGTTVTEVPGPSQLHPGDNTGNTTYKPKDGTPTPHEQCKAALVTAPKGSLCWDSYSLLIVTDCADVPAPTILLVATKTDDGSTSWLMPDARADAPVPPSTDWTTSQYLYVHNAAWPAGQPDCWVRGWTTEEWRINGTDPSAPFLERKVEGMADLPDPPLTPDPMYLPGEEPPPAAPPA